MSKPWRDESVLRELYLEKGLTDEEIANRLETTRMTVNRWRNKYGIDKPWKDKNTLEELYTDKKLSMAEISDKFGCTKETILYWIREHDIDTRTKSESVQMAMWKKPASYYTDHYGYERWQTHYNNEKESVVSVHRLLAVSEYGFDSVCGMDVHHKNPIPWLNTPENIELMTPEEHSAMHRRNETREYERDESGKITGWT